MFWCSELGLRPKRATATAHRAGPSRASDRPRPGPGTQTGSTGTGLCLLTSQPASPGSSLRRYRATNSDRKSRPDLARAHLRSLASTARVHQPARFSRKFFPEALPRKRPLRTLTGSPAQTRKRPLRTPAGSPAHTRKRPLRTPTGSPARPDLARATLRSLARLRASLLASGRGSRSGKRRAVRVVCASRCGVSRDAAADP